MGYVAMVAFVGAGVVVGFEALVGAPVVGFEALVGAPVVVVEALVLTLVKAAVTREVVATEAFVRFNAAAVVVRFSNGGELVCPAAMPHINTMTNTDTSVAAGLDMAI